MAGHSAAFESAVELANQGDQARAELLLAESVKSVVARHGPRSREAAEAHNEVGLFLLRLGRDAEAVAPLRAACALEFPGDEAATGNRLAFLLNLGRALDRSGESEEAERILNEGLIARERLYGRDHPGFAFGLEPLAEVLLRRGKLAEARAAIVEAVQILLACEHRRFATAAALQAEVLKSIDPNARVFGFLEPLEDEELATVVEAVIKRRGMAPPLARRRALEELSEVLAEELGPRHELRTRVMAELAAT